jgi:excisionase family DNA binding protein
MELQFYRIKQLTEILSISRSTIYAFIQQGRFPRPQKYGRVSLWSQEAVQQFINTGKDSK